MKEKKIRKNKIAKWFKEIDWSFVYFFLLSFIVVGGIIGFAAYINEKNKQKSAEEKLSIEEFTYRGHQYIKFRGDDAWSTFSVVHDPNCVCQTKRDSI